jgi:hypothetical protein
LRDRALRTRTRVDLWGVRRGWEQQIPYGNDRKKSKSKNGGWAFVNPTLAAKTRLEWDTQIGGWGAIERGDCALRRFRRCGWLGVGGFEFLELVGGALGVCWAIQGLVDADELEVRALFNEGGRVLG